MEKPVKPQRAIDKALLVAIRTQNIAEVRRALQAGASPNAQEVLLTHPDVLKGDPGGRHYYADTALIIAIRESYEPIVRLLLDHNADVNIRGEADWTPLMASVVDDNLAVVRQLLARKARVNLTDSYGRTPLDRASDANNTHPDTREIARLLIKAGGKRLTKPSSYEQDQRESEAEEKRTQKIIRAWPQRDLKVISEDHVLVTLFLQDVSDVLAKEEAAFGREHGRFVNLCIGSKAHPYEAWYRYARTAEEELQITLELRRSLLVRNQKSISWKALALPTDFRFGDSFSSLNRYERLYRPTKPAESTIKDARLWLDISLPGYSKGYHLAVIDFRFGPTPHGASGSYLWEKRASHWQVVWRNFRYYV